MTVGESTARSDGAAKARGEAIYGVDVAFAGMLHAGILRSPIPAGRIIHLDVSPARSISGVRAVITADDVPHHRTGLVINDQPIFASEYVCHEGEAIAAVAADTLAQVREALDAIKIEFEEQVAVVDLDHAVASGTRPVHPDWESFSSEADIPRYDNVAGEMLSNPDGVDEAFSAAYAVVEDSFGADRQYQAYLEPRAVVATHEVGRFTLHVSHQFPFNVRDRVAATLGIRKSAVRVIGHHIGGGFGAKLDISIEPHAALLAQATGRPVRLALDRSEDLLTCAVRDNAVIRIRSAVSAEGRILAREMDVIMDSGAYATDGPFLASIPLILAGAVYKVGPTRVRCRVAYTNTTPTGAFRGVNGAYLVFALERHMDNIAGKLNIDRMRLRLENLMEDGDLLLNGQELPDASILAEAYARVEEVAPWDESGVGPLRGVGVAASLWLTNPMPASVTLKLNEDGSLGLITGATENGSGAIAMGVTQIVAAAVGVGVEDVIVTMPDTDVASYDAGSQGSRTTHVVGRAVKIAAGELREQILRVAASLLEAAEEDLEIVGGGVNVKGVPGARVMFAEIAETATSLGESITATGSYATPMPAHDPTCATGMLFPAFPTPTYHVHLAEVEVDPITGQVEVVRYVVAQEVGKVINPVGVLGQIQGAVAQGIGYALYEGLQVGGDGRYLQRTLEAYRLPIALDVPTVEVILLEHADAAGPHGAKGVAEPPIIPVAAAIANAVADAIGASIDAIPITPERVLQALERSSQ